MPDNKTLVFSFDGTGNEPDDANNFRGDESISNVLKLHVLMGGGIDTDRSETTTSGGNRQITYYYNGIGTREEGRSLPVLGSLVSFVNKVVAPTWGDAQRILDEAKEDFENAGYVEGDTLVVFGFSRGAALARTFASLILASHPQCEVSFLGVFDTVTAMDGIQREGERISSDVVFENGTLNTRINKAVHIVSLDETRVSFRPTLINKDEAQPARILEVWFPGVHSDIGGGYWFDGLSDVTLQFMIKECQRVLKGRIAIYRGTNASIRRLLEEQGSALSLLTVDDLAIHPIIHGMLHEHSGWLAGAGGQQPRIVCVNDNDQPSRNGDIPILHHSVKDRFHKVPAYRPPALREKTFRLLLKNGRKSEPIHGVSGLRAFKF